MAVKRLGPGRQLVNEDRANWGRSDGSYLGYGGDASAQPREAAKPIKPGKTQPYTAKNSHAKEESVAINIRLPTRILDHYKKGGRGYQTRIIEDLRKIVDAQPWDD